MEWEPLDLTAPLQPRLPDLSIPLTALQRRLWNLSLDQNAARPSLRLCASAVRILGPFDLSLFEQSLTAAVRRHESLRTRFVAVNGAVYQEADPAGACSLKVVDLTSLSASAAEGEVMRQAQAFIDRPIDLRVGPLFEARVWKLQSEQHVLVVLIDHMISDGMSNGILTRELWGCYDQLLRGDPPAAAELPIQFGDYAVWQERTRESWMRAHAAHWQRHLSDVRPTALPLNPASSDASQPAGLTAHVPFGEALTATLRKAAQRERALLSVFVLTAYAVVISSWCRQNDILIAFPAHGRNHPALRNVIGFIANVLYLRVSVLGEESLRDLLTRVKGEVATALQHRDFDRVPELVPECATDVIFNWQATHSRTGAVEHHVILECATALGHADTKNKLSIVPLPARTPSKLKFSPVIFDTPASLQMAVAYRPDILTLATVEQFCHNVMLVTQRLAGSSATRISSVLAELDHRRPGQARETSLTRVAQ